MKFNEVICDRARWWKCPAVYKGTRTHTRGQAHTWKVNLSYCMNIYKRGERENIQ